MKLAVILVALLIALLIAFVAQTATAFDTRGDFDENGEAIQWNTPPPHSPSTEAALAFPEERKCAACVLFATALRRASFETHPDWTVTDVKKRRRALHAEDRLTDITDEAMDMALTKYHFVDSDDFESPDEDNDNSNLDKERIDPTISKMRAKAVGRFCLFEAVRPALHAKRAEKIEHTLKQGIQHSLLHFIHDGIVNHDGDAVEAVAERDQMVASDAERKKKRGNVELLRKGVFASEPRGGYEHLNGTLGVLINVADEHAEQIAAARGLCQAHCGGNKNKKSDNDDNEDDFDSEEDEPIGLKMLPIDVFY